MAASVSVVEFVNRVLDLTWQRHEVIADNIARSGLPDATRLDMGFDAALKDAEKTYRAGGKSELAGLDIDAYVSDTSEAIVLETELVNLTRNTLLYQGLITARGEYTNIMSMAISGEIK